MLTKLKYVDFLTLVPPNDGSYAVMSWQTSIFDPQAGIGGHQPLWHDTFQNIYSFYRVHGIKSEYKELDDTKSTFGADPVRMANVSLLYNSPMGTTATNMQVWVKLTYYVEFWQRQMPTGS